MSPETLQAIRIAELEHDAALARVECAATKAILAKVGARARELRLTCRGLGQQLGRHKRLLADMTRATARRKHGAQVTARIERELRAALAAAVKELETYGVDDAADEARAALRNRTLLPSPADTIEENLGRALGGLLEEHEYCSPEIREQLARRLHALFNGPMESPETERVFIDAAEKIEAICARNKAEIQATGATRALDALRAEIRPAEAAGDSGQELLVATVKALACPRCDGCGQVADTEDEEPWTAWTELPLASSGAVLSGLVRPKPCPSCSGSKVAPAGGARA